MEPMQAGEASPSQVTSGPAFSAGRVISRTFSIWGRNALVFSGVALLIHLPSIALAFAGVGASGPNDPVTLLKAFLSNVLSLVTAGALTIGVLRSLAGERPGIGALLATGLAKLGWIFLISFGVGLLVGCGTLLLVVPGLIALAGCYVAVPAVVAERNGSRDAISRSWELTRGRRWPVLGAAVVFAVGTVALAYVAGAAIGWASYAATGRVGGGALGLVEIVAVALGGIAQCAPAVAYHDLRLEKEGASTEELAAVFE